MRYQSRNQQTPFRQAPVAAEAVKIEVKTAEDVATWGATKRRTTQPKPREAGTTSELQVAVESQAASSNSSVITYQAGNPARLKAHARSKVVKKEKEQTLTATLTERSEVGSQLQLLG